MTIEELIPKLDDIYTDQKGLLHIDINLPKGNENNYLMVQQLSKQIKPRIKELYDLTDYEKVEDYTSLNCYLCTVWKKKQPSEESCL